MDENRMAGDYEITVAVPIGYCEIVMGENKKSPEAQFLCATYTANDLFGNYDNAVVSDSYAEIAALFGERLADAANEVIKQAELVGVDTTPITSEHCFVNNYKKSIDGKVVAIKLDTLKPEFRTADKQLYLVTGGFGAQANSRGNAVFCTNIYSGKQTRWERYDIQGEVKPEHLPSWATEKMKNLQTNEKQTSKEER